MPYIPGSPDKYDAGPEAVLRLDATQADRITQRLHEFYQEHLESAGVDGYVIGMSGGVDSTTVAHLLADAVGPDNVYGVILPAEHTDEQDVQDAQDMAAKLGIATNNPDRFQDRIDRTVDGLVKLGEPVDDDQKQRVKRGNVLARCRMIVLRDVAKARNALVAGTTNASERLLGYLTLAADGKGGVDNEALYDLYKTTERDLARHIGVDSSIVEKTPTADLWPGQTDQDELDFTYDVLDQVLAGLQLEQSPEDIAEAAEGVSQGNVEQIQARVERSRYKNEPAPIPDLSGLRRS